MALVSAGTLPWTTLSSSGHGLRRDASLSEDERHSLASVAHYVKRVERTIPELSAVSF